MALIKQSAKGDLTTHGRKLFGELCTGMDLDFVACAGQKRDG